MVDQQRQVLAPLAERRERDGHHVDAVVEVLAEATVAHQGLQIAMGRGEEPHVDRDRPARPDALELALLQDPEQLHLQVGGQIADLVEEQAPAVGQLEAALAGGDGAGEGALLVTEQLGLEQALGERGAVDLDERPRRPRARVVDRLGDQLLARCRSRPGSARWRRSARPGARATAPPASGRSRR